MDILIHADKSTSVYRKRHTPAFMSATAPVPLHPDPKTVTQIAYKASPHPMLPGHGQYNLLTKWTPLTE